jgi:hypothetical protein
VKTFLRLAALVGLAAAAAEARAFVRETTTPGNPATGYCVWWKARRVGYRVNASGSAETWCTGQADKAAAAIAAVDTAFAAWNPACSDFRFADDGTTTNTGIGNDGMNLIVFRTGPCSEVAPGTDGCWSTPGACARLYNCWEHGASGGTDAIALTTTTFKLSTGELLDADVEFYGWDGTAAPAFGNYLTCEGPVAPTCVPVGAQAQPLNQTGCNWLDVTAVTLHEAGHMLGLDHDCQYAAPHDSCPAASVMMPSILPGDVTRLIAQDDSDAACAIYPSGKATATCNPPTQGPSGCGCGAAGGGPAALLALLAFAAPRRRAAPRRLP